MPRSRSLSVNFSGSQFYHVTKQCNLPGIAASGLDPGCGGSANGMSSAKGSQKFVANSKRKVHLTSSWSTVKRYVDHSIAILEKNNISNPSQYPAVLSIWLPSLEKAALSPDPDDSTLSYYLTSAIMPSSIKVAMADANNMLEYVADTDTEWVPVSLYAGYANYIPTYPDVAPSQDSVFTGM